MYGMVRQDKARLGIGRAWEKGHSSGWPFLFSLELDLDDPACSPKRPYCMLPG